MIKINSLSFARGNSLILKDISFSVKPGQIMLIQGPNGKGKTTLLLNIIQLLDPLNGDVKLNGQKIDSQTASDCFLYLGENHFAYDQLTLNQNIDYWLSIHNVVFTKDIINKSIKYLFGELNLDKKFFSPNDSVCQEDHVCEKAYLLYEGVANLINDSENIFKTLTWDYMARAEVFFYAFALIYIFKEKSFYTKILSVFVLIAIILFQINSLIVPFVKDKIYKIENYQNLFTFKGYYNHYDYSKIKNIVKNKRVISVGVDPMVSVYHDINVMDGYHTIYPLSYKKKFRKIIKNT